MTHVASTLRPDPLRHAARFAAALLAVALAVAAASPAPARAAELTAVDPELQLRAPALGQPLADPRPRFEIGLPASRGEALLYLDGVDVTASARRQGDLLTFQPAQPLAQGAHELTLVVADPEGVTTRAWKFAVDLASRGGLQGFVHGGLSASAQSSFASKGSVDPVTGSSTLALTAGAQAGRWEASLSGHGGWFPGGPSPTVTAGGFLWALKRDQDSLTLGDVSASGTSYVAPGLSRRGLLLSLRHLDSTLQAFQLASRPVQGNDLGISWSNWSDQLLGASLVSGLPAGMQLQASYVQGRQSSGSSFATASIDGPSEGRAAGLALSGTLLGASVALEGAISDHDANTRDGNPAVRDQAGALRLGRAFGPVNLSGQYEWVGPGFESIGNPGATRDRRQLGLSASTSLGPVSLSASGGRGNDNVGGDAARPVITNLSGGASVGLALARWPSLSLSYVRGLIGAERVPAGVEPVDTVSDAASASLAWARGGYSASLAANQSWLTDRRTNGADSTSTGLSLAFSARPVSALTISPTGSRNVAESAGVTRTTDLATLALAATLWPKVLTLTGQGSWAKVAVSDGSAGSEQLGGVLRLGWELHRLLGRLADHGTAVLGASARWSRVQQAGPAPSSTSTWGAFVTLDVYAPIQLGQGGGGGRGSDGGRAGVPSTAAAVAVQELAGSPPHRITGTARAGPLTFKRVELTFRDGRGEALTMRGGALRARAQISYAGTGALQARWLVDGRPVEEVSLALLEGDVLVVETSSDATLATFEPGRHVVSMELLLPAPPPGFQAPELTYVVTAEQAAPAPAPGGRP